jgi:hypothetical protein
MLSRPVSAIAGASAGPDGFNDPTSIMDDAAHPNDDDIGRVAGLELASCVAARRKKRATR